MQQEPTRKQYGFNKSELPGATENPEKHPYEYPEHPVQERHFCFPRQIVPRVYTDRMEKIQLPSVYFGDAYASKKPKMAVAQPDTILVQPHHPPPYEQVLSQLSIPPQNAEVLADVVDDADVGDASVNTEEDPFILEERYGVEAISAARTLQLVGEDALIDYRAIQPGMLFDTHVNYTKYITIDNYVEISERSLVYVAGKSEPFTKSERFPYHPDVEYYLVASPKKRPGEFHTFTLYISAGPAPNCVLNLVAALKPDVYGNEIKLEY